MTQKIILEEFTDESISVKPPLSRYQELLLLFFYAGEIELSAWEQYLREDAALAAYFNSRADRMN